MFFTMYLLTPAVDDSFRSAETVSVFFLGVPSIELVAWASVCLKNERMNVKHMKECW